MAGLSGGAGGGAAAQRGAGFLPERVLHRCAEPYRRMERIVPGPVPHHQQGYRRGDEPHYGADHRPHPHQRRQGPALAVTVRAAGSRDRRTAVHGAPGGDHSPGGVGHAVL